MKQYKTDDVDELRIKVMRFVGFRPRSVSEVKRYLKQKTDNQRVISELIDELLELKILDDLDFAKWLVDSRLRHKSKGQLGLRVELQKFGVDREIINSVLMRISRDTFLQSAIGILEKKAQLLLNLPADKQKQKAYRLLLSRGYSSDIAQEAFDSWLVAE